MCPLEFWLIPSPSQIIWHAGDKIPACSALFLPIFDPSDPFTRNRLTGSMVPSAMLEVLVCKTAQMVNNNSDLLNSACTVMDKYKVHLSLRLGMADAGIENCPLVKDKLWLGDYVSQPYHESPSGCSCIVLGCSQGQQEIL